MSRLRQTGSFPSEILRWSTLLLSMVFFMMAVATVHAEIADPVLPLPTLRLFWSDMELVLSAALVCSHSLTCCSTSGLGIAEVDSGLYCTGSFNTVCKRLMWEVKLLCSSTYLSAWGVDGDVPGADLGIIESCGVIQAGLLPLGAREVDPRLARLTSSWNSRFCKWLEKSK